MAFARMTQEARPEEPARPDPQAVAQIAPSGYCFIQPTKGMTMGEDGKASTLRFIEDAWNSGRFDQAREHLAPAFVNHTPFGDENQDEFLARIDSFRSAFADFTMVVDQMLSDGEYVTTRWSATGVHRGVFRDITPTGRRVRLSGIAIDRIVDGHRVEGWALIDLIGLLQQLGATMSVPGTKN
ncbi:ester cyclase [Sinomonas atrocyanea]